MSERVTCVTSSEMQSILSQPFLLWKYFEPYCSLHLYIFWELIMYNFESHQVKRTSFLTSLDIDTNHQNN